MDGSSKCVRSRQRSAKSNSLFRWLKTRNYPLVIKCLVIRKLQLPNERTPCRNIWKLNFLNRISDFDLQRTSSGFYGTFYACRHFNNDETHKCQIQRFIFLFVTIESRNMDLFNFCLLWSKHCFIFGVSIFTLRMENRYVCMNNFWTVFKNY